MAAPLISSRIRIDGDNLTAGQSNYSYKVKGSGILRGVLVRLLATIEVTGAATATTKGLLGLFKHPRLKRSSSSPLDWTSSVDIRDLIEGQAPVTLKKTALPATTTAPAQYEAFFYLDLAYGLKHWRGFAGLSMADPINLEFDIGNLLTDVYSANAVMTALSFEFWGDFDKVLAGHSVPLFELYAGEETYRFSGAGALAKKYQVPSGKGLVLAIARIDQDESAGEKDDIDNVGIYHNATDHTRLLAAANQEAERTLNGCNPVDGQYLIHTDLQNGERNPMTTDGSTAVLVDHNATGAQSVRAQWVYIDKILTIKG
jgi:hypothetical protein